jgi:IPTL-CTERM motif
VALDAVIRHPGPRRGREALRCLMPVAIIPALDWGRPIPPVWHGISSTAENRFFGVTNPGGISSIRISNTSGGIEVDHLQYGLFGAAPAAIDLPTTSQTALLLLALLMAAFAWRALVRRRIN